MAIILNRHFLFLKSYRFYKISFFSSKGKAFFLKKYDLLEYIGGINLQVNFEVFDQNLVVKLIGELDHHFAEEIREKIDREIDQNEIKNIVFDLSEINFMDSSGIGVVIGRYKKVQRKGGQVAVINMNSRIEHIFKMSGLFNIVQKFRNKKQAFERL